MRLGGCTVGPDFHSPDPPAATSITKEPLPERTQASPIAGGEAQQFVLGRDIPGEWWALFQSEPLTTLIEESLKANPDLQTAQAALRVAMESVRAQQGMYFPTIGGGLSSARSKNAGQLSPTLASSQLLYNLYEAQLNVIWTPDIFGANRRQIESLQAQADARRFELEATYLALTANVVSAAVEEASLRAQLAAAEDVIKLEGDALEIVRHQNASGQVAGAAVAAQEAALAQAQQTLPQLQKQLSQQRDLLTALSGRLPAEEIEQTFELSSLQLPAELPVSLPSQLVAQRPDIRIAEENLHAASAQIGVALANMLPNITLTAGDGTVATKLSQLLQPGNGFWTIGASLTQPIFEGGTLRARTRAAESAYDQAAFIYRSTVITAFQSVADTLHALQYDADSLKAAMTSETAAARSLDIARRQLELGQTAYLNLLAAQQSYQQALINRIQIQAARYADTAALFQALGGGWWNRSDVVTATGLDGH
jgi:NodT family efflux transporter outer membrane factor (OMF) lipoprotein